MRSRLIDICSRINTPDPKRTASQLQRLINGAYATGYMTYDSQQSINLTDTTERLIG